MSKAPTESEKITDYLLGSLSAEETEQLDELSITDGEFAEALVASEGELIDAYVLNELDPESRKRFESCYQSTSVKREKVEFAKALQEFGHQASAGAIIQPEPSRWFLRLKSSLSGPSILQWGFAAAVLVLLGTTIWLAWQNLRLQSEVSAVRADNNELARSQQQLRTELDEAQRLAQAFVPTPAKTDHNETIDQPASSTILSLVLTPLLRGAQQKPTVNLNSDTTGVRVKLVLEPNELSTYRVELLPQNEKPVWRAVNLKAQAHNGDRSIVVMLPVRLLKAQDFILRVSGTAQNGSSELVGDYPFAITQAYRVR